MPYLYPSTKIPTLERWWVQWFWDKNFKYNEATGCLEWTKSVSKYGYGRASINNKNYFAHRVAYYIYYQVDPGELLVRHICDNPRCCHPFHLELGTHIDNSGDMVRRGRTSSGDNHWMRRMPERYEQWKKNNKGKYNLPTNGQEHPCTVLDGDAVRDIRQRRQECKGNRKLIGRVNRELAEKYGVTHSNISAVALGKSHQHVE